MNKTKNGGISRRSMLLSASSVVVALSSSLTWSPSGVLAQMWTQDLEAHISAYRSSVAAYLKNHGQYASPRAFAALIDHVGSDNEQAIEDAIAKILRDGERFIMTPARSYEEASRKYLILSEVYHRMHTQDASGRFWMSAEDWNAWLVAMEADLDKYDVNVQRWWRGGGPGGVYVDGIRYAWTGNAFEPMDEWHDIAA